MAKYINFAEANLQNKRKRFQDRKQELIREKNEKLDEAKKDKDNMMNFANQNSTDAENRYQQRIDKYNAELKDLQQKKGVLQQKEKDYESAIKQLTIDL